MRAAAVQLNSTQDRERNLAAADRLTRDAAEDGAQLVVLPERVDVRGGHEDYERHAAPIEDHPTVEWARELARDLRIDLIAGSVAERRDGHDKLANTSVHVGPDGDTKAVYRKIHLFDVQVGDIEYLESESDEGGNEIVVTDLADGTKLGLSICYDLRFPELYRILAVKGARILTVPANFTHPTGSAHWEVLLRARAVEDPAFVIAAAQVGEHPGDMGRMYGNSLIADPWGEVLARADDSSETYVIADLDFERQDDVRAKLPSLAGRVPAAYTWPEGATL
jgi:deaminated glutathione amidase